VPNGAARTQAPITGDGETPPEMAPPCAAAGGGVGGGAEERQS